MYITEADMVKFDIHLSNCLGGEVQSMRTIQNPPQINVIFADKSIDNFELKHHRMKADSPIRCNYLGHLRSNRSSIVAVTGCLDELGDKMDITMFSEKAKNKMYTVDCTGKTEALKGPFEDGGFRIFNFNILFSL